MPSLPHIAASLLLVATLTGQPPAASTREPSAAELAAMGQPAGRPSEQFYFVLPDRFANGDPSNDRGGLPGDRLQTGYDPTDKGFYHGGDLQGVIDRLDYIEGLGTTAIWLAPVFKNRPVQGSGSDVSAGYHGYWINDFTQVDPHFGSNADLKRLVQLAHGRGLKIYLDVIVNHTADVIQYAENRYDYVDKKTSPYTDKRGHAFEDANYADGTQGFPKVDGNAGPYTPVFATAADKTVKKPAWLNDPALYHNRGNSTFSGENSTYGDFFGLDDLWTERPDVVSGMTKIYQDWIGSTGVDGFRLDTVKHVDMPFWPRFSQGITNYAAAHGRPDFFMFGEVFSADPAYASTFVRQGGLPATLDFAFQAAAQGFVTGGSGQGLADLYAADPYYSARDTDANAMPTFLGNHDMGRIGSFISRSGVDSSTYLDRDRLAHELMFLTRGQPVVYSGDEQGFTGPGGDKDARQDLFASRVADYLDDDLLGTDRTHAVDNYNPEHPLYQAIARLGQLRAAHSGLSTGTQTTRFAGDGVFAFSRLDSAQRIEYVVAANGATAPKTITVGTASGANAAYDQIYPSAGSGPSTGADGKLTVTVPALSTVVLRAQRPVAPVTGTPTITITGPGDGAKVATQARVSASVADADPTATVTFAAQVGSGAWRLLGTATHPDADGKYTVMHDLTGLGGTTPVKYKAVVNSLGRLATDESAITVATAIQGAQREYVLVHYRRTDGDYATWGLYNWGDSDPSSQHPWPQGQPFAGEDSYGRFAWVKVRPGATNVGFLVVNSDGVKDVEADRSLDPSRVGEIWLKQGDPAQFQSPAAALGYQTIRYHRNDGDYSGWGLHLWGDGIAHGTDWGSPMPPTGTDAFGAFWNVELTDPTKVVNFIVHKGDTKDPGPDQSVDPTQGTDAFIMSGENAVYASEAAASKVAVLHYRRTDGNYAGWGLHLWDGAATPTDWGSAMPPTGTDAYGAYWRVPLTPGATALSYIIHKGDEKDLPEDQKLTFSASGNEVWIQQATRGYLRPQVKSAPRDIDLTHSYAQWIDRSTIVWNKGETDGKVYDLVVAPHGGVSIEDGHLTGDYTAIRMAAKPNGLTEKQRAAYPHLWNYHAFDLDATKETLKAQLIAVEKDHEGTILSATGVQIAGAVDDWYASAAYTKLGPNVTATATRAAIWAPTATGVALELMDTPTSPVQLVAMRRDDTTGVWSVTGPRSWNGKYYRFQVTAYQPATRAFVTASVTDPYSLSLAVNSTASQFVALSDAALKPAGWDALRKPVMKGRPQIQEVSVRDFSISDTTVPAEQRGTYLAFTAADSAGLKHLRELSGAGVTHLHLLPTFDFATTPERRADQAQPACDLPSLPRDSSAQQDCINAVRDTDGYNWGYDPLHYTVPEGGYAVDPSAARIREYRQMVAGINGSGLRVVADVVYNHTSASGVARGSILDQIVPGYYHRLMADGTVATSTCCANTATEHTMMGKLVVDSVVTWAREYKVDGFRFDLMGHHPKANILAVRRALDDLTVGRDGVDGKKIVLYGEGWNFGEVGNDARFEQATQANMAGTGVATFSDRLRDAARGGGPFDGNPGLQGFASGLWSDPNGDPVNGSAADQRARLLHQEDLIQLGLAGNLRSYSFRSAASGSVVTGAQVDYNGSPAGYTSAPAEAVTYVDAHDNEILYDALTYKLPASTPATDRARMQVLALSTVAMSQGTGFVTLGSDRLRSKSLDKNSYNSGDWFNAIRWDCSSGNGFGIGLPPAADNSSRWAYARPLLADPALTPSCAAVDLASARYAEMMRIRSESPVFSLPTTAAVQERVSFPLSGTPSAAPGVITMVLDARGLGGAYQRYVVVFNSTPSTVNQTVAGAGWRLHPTLATSADPVLRTASAAGSTLTVPGRSVAVFVQ